MDLQNMYAYSTYFQPIDINNHVQSFENTAFVKNPCALVLFCNQNDNERFLLTISKNLSQTQMLTLCKWCIICSLSCTSQGLIHLKLIIPCLLHSRNGVSIYTWVSSYLTLIIPSLSNLLLRLRFPISFGPLSRILRHQQICRLHNLFSTSTTVQICNSVNLLNIDHILKY